MEDGLTAVTSPVWTAIVWNPVPSGFLIVNSPWSPPKRPKPPPNSLPPNGPPGPCPCPRPNGLPGRGSGATVPGACAAAVVDEVAPAVGTVVVDGSVWAKATP